MDEVTAAVKRLKAKHLTALLTVEDLAFLTDLCTSSKEEHENEYITNCTEQQGESDQDDEISAYMADDDLPISKQTFAKSHSRSG